MLPNDVSELRGGALKAPSLETGGGVLKPGFTRYLVTRKVLLKLNAMVELCPLEPNRNS